MQEPPNKIKLGHPDYEVSLEGTVRRKIPKIKGKAARKKFKKEQRRAQNNSVAPRPNPPVSETTGD